MLFLGPLDRCPRANRLHEMLDRESVDFVGGPSVELVQPESTLSGRLWRLSLLLLGCYEHYLESRYQLLVKGEREYDFVVCHDVLLLSTVRRHFPSSRIIVDLREFYPAQNESSFLWRCTFGRLASYVCSHHAGLADAFVSVSPGLASLYERTFGIRSTVIMSFPHAQKSREASFPNWPLKIVYHGIATPARRIEQSVLMMHKLTGIAELHLVLVPTDDRYLARLKRLSEQTQAVWLHPPVPSDQIGEMLRQYDIGLVLLDPELSNHAVALPNKLFEYLQAGLMVVTTPGGEVESFVNREGVGCAASSIQAEALADVLLSLDLTAVASYQQKAVNVSRNFTSERFASDFRAIMHALQAGSFSD